MEQASTRKAATSFLMQPCWPSRPLACTRAPDDSGSLNSISPFLAPSMKRLFSVGLLVSLAGMVQAQGLHVGVLAGGTASTYQGKQVPQARFRGGATAGLWVRLPLRSWVDLQPELLYEPRGAGTQYGGVLVGTFSSFRYSFREQSRLHYVSLPVLARLHWGKTFLLVGPHLSYLLARRSHVRETTIPMPPGNPDQVRSSTSIQTSMEGYHRRQVGYSLGLGYQLTPRLAVQGRFTGSWTQVQAAQQLVSPNDLGREGYHARNLAWQAQVAYQLSKTE
jgi:hypothetical protein